MSVGVFIRQHVIPQGMSVTDAAKRLGVGRPALSNLLNGKSSLSPTMALRLEKVFGADRQELQDLQAQAGRDRRREEDRAVAVQGNVPPFLATPITARRIDSWADRIEARDYLPVLLRRLVHSTGRGLRRVDFPGGDNAQRPGWDGWVEADAATPWVPKGKSGWEVSTNKQPAAKAGRDYAKRVASISVAERMEHTFVFVTPRTWRGKNDWASRMETRGNWKEVRAYDASDLEQWLEASITGQIWLAEQLDLPTDGFGTLDRAWKQWAEASEPQMTAKIFEPSITAFHGTFSEWLGKSSRRPFVVAADSKDEALAFLACLFEHVDMPANQRNRAVVIESAQTLRTLAATPSPFIPIVSNEEAERELTTVYRQRHCIVVRPRNYTDREPDIALQPLGREAFETALADMGIERDALDRLSRASGRSPTILRRRLSCIDAIRGPEWARDLAIARSLIPMALVGAWHKGSSADCEILSVLAGGDYQNVEETIAHMLELDDCPVWSVGQHRGVVSKIDVLFAVGGSMTEKNIVDFLELAEYVLSEVDPALGLPEDRRWAAGFYGKVRDHSKALRDGFCETLVLLSVHGNDLFQNRLGIDVEGRVSRLVRRLLTPLTLEKLLSQEDYLPRYAEAAPDEFLQSIETDLRLPEPVLQGLLKPAGNSLFSDCPCTGLLWALECLAWDPRNLSRVSAILAQLAKTKLDDNWSNKPIASLAAVYWSWMPQTAATLDERMQGLEMLVSRFPDVGWHICTWQFDPDQQQGSRSYRPHWRAVPSDAGEVVTKQEQDAFARKALGLALAWHKHDSTTLGDLVERLAAMSPDDQSTVWGLIDAWARDEADETAKVQLRERIRRSVLTGRGRQRGLTAATHDRARAASRKLEPRDVVSRHAWLFASERVVVPSDAWVEGEQFDHVKREAWIHERRTKAMSDIWTERGFAGVASLLASSGAAHVVGRYAGLNSSGLNAAADILRSCLSADAEPRDKIDAFMCGVVWHTDARRQFELLSTVVGTSTPDQKVRLLCCAQFGEQTWRILNQQPQDVRDRYWREVGPYGPQLTEAEITESIDRFLDAGRPHTAFHAVRWEWKKVETSRFKRLLTALAAANDESGPGDALEALEISQALDALDGRAGVTSVEMARLELAFIGALDYSKHGIPNLERQIEEWPILFVQALAYIFKRSGDGQDPPEWQFEDAGQRDAAATAAYRFLEGVSRIPGTASDDTIDAQHLLHWVKEVRSLCAEHGRADVGDRRIGQLLAKAPADQSGVWPCRSVCEVMETIPSEHIERGFSLGVYNARVIHTRGEGDEQAARYRGWARRIEFEHPYTSGVLGRIADLYEDEARQENSEAVIRRRLLL